MVIGARQWARGAAIGLMLFVAGCYVPEFEYGTAEKKPGKPGRIYQGHILSPYGTVELHGNAIRVHPGGIVAMRKEALSDYRVDFKWKLLSGEGMRLRLRSVDRGRSVDSGISLVVIGGNWRVEGAGLSNRGSLPASGASAIPVHIHSDREYLSITSGCDETIRRRVMLTPTDALVFESVGDGEAEITDLTGVPLD